MNEFLQVAKEFNAVLDKHDMRLSERAGKVSLVDSRTGVKVELSTLFSYIAREQEGR